MTSPMPEFTRASIELAVDWLDLPGNERDEFARAIAARAAWWRLSEEQQAQE